MNSKQIIDLKESIKKGHHIAGEEALALIDVQDKKVLYECANDLRVHFCGNHMDLCSITNAKSGKCSENCKWCSQSAWHKTNVDVYPLVDKAKAVEEAVHNAQKGVIRHSLVTSGRTATDKELDDYIDIFKQIRNKSSIQLCASMGLLTREQLKRLKDIGITHYHCNLETAPSYFKEVCTTHTVEDKIKTIGWANELGIGVCSGGIIGMGETMAQRVELAFALRDLGVKSIPINVLNPIEGTGLQGAKLLTEEEVLTTIALFRFVNPDAFLRFAGGRLLIRHFQDKALKAGINASIVGDMLTTVGSNIEEDLRDFSASGFTFK